MIRLFETVLPSMVFGSFETIVMLIVNIGLLVFIAKDVRLGFLFGLVLNAGLFAWFYEAGLNYAVPMVVMFICLILLAFSIYGISRFSNVQGGFI